MWTHCSRVKTMTRGSIPTYLYAVGIASHLVRRKMWRVSSIRPYFSHWRSASLCLAILYSSRREKIVKFLQSNPVQVLCRPHLRKSRLIVTRAKQVIHSSSSNIRISDLYEVETDLRLPRSNPVQVWPQTLIVFMLIVSVTFSSTQNKSQVYFEPSYLSYNTRY